MTEDLTNAGTDPATDVPAKTRTDAEHFLALYSAVHERFYRRVRPTTYRPSLESLAVMRHLAAVGPLTIGEAADHFSRSQAATSEIITRLEQRDLVERVPDHRDRRRTLVWLSPEGIQTVQRAANALSERTIAEAFTQIDDDERARLLHGMQALLDTKPSDQGWEDE
jgi:DNA-binding MarR family transcriptional regulator